jgi:UDP-N-acetylmuramoyl-tripeptide--D-alanyl-D-alanine ligase
MEVTDRPDGVTVINDAYNANPESMRAAIEALGTISSGDGRVPRRSWAVLGEMAELGAAGAAAHAEIGRLAATSGVHRLVAIATQRYGEESMVVPDVGAALALLEAELAPGDVVLVKASRSAGLERLAAGLIAQNAEASR